MKRILFVDDESMVLDGLRRSLFGQRREWQMEFCASPIAACELVAKQDFDVVVSDMRMPGMDGARFLEHVARDRPGALRVILSGQSEMEATLRAAVIAHQFVSKPCEGNAIVEVLARTIRLHEMLDDGALRAMVSRIKSLPVPPKTYHRLTALMIDPNVELTDVADLISRDIGLVAKVLQLVNSSFFGVSRQVTKVRDAVSMLGLQRIRSVVLCSEVYSRFDTSRLPTGFDLERSLQHAQAAARITCKMLDDRVVAEFAFVGAMLHDIGYWILAAYAPESFAGKYAAATRAGISVQELDDVEQPVPPARLGAYLLGIWNLPYPVVEAVAYHRAPGAAGLRTFDAVGAVHVADCLAGAVRAASPEEAARQMARLDRAFLAEAGVAGRIDEWLALSRAVAVEAA